MNEYYFHVFIYTLQFAAYLEFFYCKILHNFLAKSLKQQVFCEKFFIVFLKIKHEVIEINKIEFSI